MLRCMKSYARPVYLYGDVVNWECGKRCDNFVVVNLSGVWWFQSRHPANCKLQSGQMSEKLDDKPLLEAPSFASLIEKKGRTVWGLSSARVSPSASRSPPQNRSGHDHVDLQRRRHQRGCGWECCGDGWRHARCEGHFIAASAPARACTAAAERRTAANGCGSSRQRRPLHGCQRAASPRAQAFFSRLRPQAALPQSPHPQ